jgi:hypothetical protein
MGILVVDAFRSQPTFGDIIKHFGTPGSGKTVKNPDCQQFRTLLDAQYTYYQKQTLQAFSQINNQRLLSVWERSELKALVQYHNFSRGLYRFFIESQGQSLANWIDNWDKHIAVPMAAIGIDTATVSLKKTYKNQRYVDSRRSL